MIANKKAWLIDLDGTLYKPKLLKWGMALELGLMGLGSVSVIKAFRHAHEALREELRINPGIEFLPSPFDEQIRRAASATGKSESDVHSIIDEWMIERPGKWIKKTRRNSLISEIAAFRKAGGKTAIVSDYPASKKLAALECTELFDQVVCSGETKGLTRLKPCPDAFLLAAQKLGLEADDCLVLGDREDADGAAASAAGMDFRWVH